MKKYVFYVVLVLFSGLLASCGDDDGDPIPSYDKNNIIGHYIGKCTINYGVKSKVNNAYPAAFSMDSSNGALLNAILGDESTFEEDGLGQIGNITMSRFLNYGSYASFKMSAIAAHYQTGKIPAFIRQQVDAFDVQSAQLTMSCDEGGKYDVANKVVSFTYKGTLEVFGDRSQRYTNNISYTFFLTKQE